MGHGGNTGSQTVSTIIRALALRQIGQRDMLRTLVKEAVAGCIMGGIIGAAIMIASAMWPGLGPGVGLTVGVALPIISMWANACGTVLTLLADRFKFDPAVTSVPLMTTIVDATGLVFYFWIAELFMDISSTAALAHAAEGKSKGTGAATAAAVAASAAGKVASGALKKLLSPPPPGGSHGKHGGKGLF